MSPEDARYAGHKAVHSPHRPVGSDRFGTHSDCLIQVKRINVYNGKGAAGALPQGSKDSATEGHGALVSRYGRGNDR